jgi:glycosyltransferase involved in cell wall biosynthesis
MKKIIILHEYDAKSHFKALYEKGREFGYEVEDYIILSNKFLLKRFIKNIIKRNNIIQNIKKLIKEFMKKRKIKNIKNNILIVGIAPYDNLLNKYKKTIENNYSYYFSSWQYWNGEDFPKGKLKNKKEFEKIINKSFLGCAVVTKETKKELVKINENIEVVNHSINIDEYKKKNSLDFSNIKKFLYLGQFIKRKNIDYIISFLQKNQHLNIEFHFAGKGKMKKKIIKLSKQDNRIKLIGYMQKSQVKKKLKDYDYLVLPSKAEPFGIVIIEALSAGVPCIVSNALGPKEIIQDKKIGFVFNKDDYNDFEKKMYEAINIDNDKYSEYSKNAINESKKYDTNYLIHKWIKLFERGTKELTDK